MKSNKQKSVLERIGFAHEENVLYRALLEIGPSSASSLVRRTGMHRPTVYRFLATLMEKKLVSLMPKGKGKAYVAESPQKLEKLFAELEDDFNVEVHSLISDYESQGRKPVVTYGEGESSLKEIYSDVVHSLKKDDVYYRYSPATTLVRKKYIPKDYRQVRDRKGLERYIITDEPSRKNMNLRLGKAAKFVPAEFGLFDMNITQIIYGNKVALLDYNTKTTIVIDNEMIAGFQKKIFKLLYSKL